MKKVTVEICCGTACYLLGSAKLLTLEEQLPEEWKEFVQIKALPCLNLCESAKLGAAPFVRLNQSEIMPEATLEKVLARIGKLINRDDD